MLSVSDTGIGIPPEDQAHLFERFRRVRGAQSRTHEGSGIGLALVAEIAQLHGGDIEVVSRPDEGSTFQVHLPFGSAHLAPERVADPSSAEVAQQVVDGFLVEASQLLGPSDAEEEPDPDHVEHGHRARASWSSTTTPTSAPTCRACSRRCTTSAPPWTAKTAWSRPSPTRRTWCSPT